MKILVIQLARLGDIYQTWPVLNALKRQNPQAEIHFATRSKFSVAAPKSGIDRLWALNTRSVLSPLIDEKPQIDLSLERLNEFAAQLAAEKFDRIINLTFSPFSSHLVRAITDASSSTAVSGYTRTDDGYLAIPDDGSAYFYAQVGVGRPNRLHVSDLFAFISGVELTEEDWNCGGVDVTEREPTVLVHVGASNLDKTLSWDKWLQVVRGLSDRWPGSVVLIGSPEEREIANQIVSVAGSRRPFNLVGETSLEELYQIIGEASLMIGGDSGPMQIASIVGTPVLNVSLPSVCFWETGPRAKGSRIIRLNSEDEIAGEQIVNEAVLMLVERPAQLPLIRVVGPTFPYLEMRPEPGAFEWDLLRGLYMDGGFPEAPHDAFLNGIERMKEINVLVREQIELLRLNPNNSTSALILDRADELVDSVAAMVPELSPIVDWFRTERLRLGPQSVESLAVATDFIHQNLDRVLDFYVPSAVTDGNEQKEGGRDDVNLE